MKVETKKNIQILLSTEIFIYLEMFYSSAIEFVLRKKKAVPNDTAHSLEDTTYEK